MCSSEITFKTDPKNGDFVVEHGASRNFENWTENDPGKTAGVLPDAAADEEYDSEGNARDDPTRDAMADLERSQEASRREMEIMDELADLRQRNARVETSRTADDPEALLAALHAERYSQEEEARLAVEQAEDDALVAQYFTKLPGPAGAKPKATATGKDKGKGRGAGAGAGGGGEGDDSGSGSGNGEGKTDQSEKDDGSGSDSDSGPEGGILNTLTIKRRPAPGTGAAGEPTVASILAAKGKTLGTAAPAAPASATAQVKRKREGMQKLLGIKKKKLPV